MMREDWLLGAMIYLEGDKIEKQVTEWWTNSYRMMKSLAKKAPETSLVAEHLREQTTEFQKKIPIIRLLASKALRKRHWDKLSIIFDETLEMDETLTLNHLLELGALEKMEEVQGVTVVAEKEFALERNLDNMIMEWEP